MKPLLHTAYATAISLHEAFKASTNLLSVIGKEGAVDQLLAVLKEPLNRLGAPVATNYDDKRRLLHAVLNILEPGVLGADEISLLDRLLQTERSAKQLSDAALLKPRASVGSTGLALFQGDITTLQIDAIVNAANSQLLGCFQPLHSCIDNAIHSAAGVQLRDDCECIMRMQGFPEPTGEAKITRAYNLPSKFVLHTVGPIVPGALNEMHRQLLGKVYTSCLELADAIPEISSLAFCCVSTGVFGYPPEAAAHVAVETVVTWLKKHLGRLDQVVFTVFTPNDYALYEALLENI